MIITQITPIIVIILIMMMRLMTDIVFEFYLKHNVYNMI